MWKKVACAFGLFVLSMSMLMGTAEAARLGGGRSIGTQRQVSPMRQVTPPANAPQQAVPGARPAPTAQPVSGGWRKWAGPLAGIAAGLGLAALFSHLGIGSGFGSVLVLVLGAIVLFWALRKLLGSMTPRQAQPAYAGGHAERVVTPLHAMPAGGTSQASVAASQAVFPPGFDVSAFTHQAKVNFVRLQAANDAGDLNDIREFTSPEMFAEIKLALDQRAGAKQRTDVVMLEAETLEVVEERGNYIASVRFYGSLREAADAAPQNFDEIWHLGKPLDGSRGWVLAGIQQLN